VCSSGASQDESRASLRRGIHRNCFGVGGDEGRGQCGEHGECKQPGGGPGGRRGAEGGVRGGLLEPWVYEGRRMGVHRRTPGPAAAGQVPEADVCWRRWGGGAPGARPRHS